MSPRRPRTSTSYQIYQQMLENYNRRKRNLEAISASADRAAAKSEVAAARAIAARPILCKGDKGDYFKYVGVAKLEDPGLSPFLSACEDPMKKHNSQMMDVVPRTKGLELESHPKYENYRDAESISLDENTSSAYSSQCQPGATYDKDNGSNKVEEEEFLEELLDVLKNVPNLDTNTLKQELKNRIEQRQRYLESIAHARAIANLLEKYKTLIDSGEEHARLLQDKMKSLKRKMEWN